MPRRTGTNEDRLKPRQIEILSAIGTKRWAVKALVQSLVAGSATPDLVGRRGRLVAKIGGLEALGFAKTNPSNEVWLTARGLDVVAEAVKASSRGRRKRAQTPRSATARRRSWPRGSAKR
jgi:hypothetical protein